MALSKLNIYIVLIVSPTFKWKNPNVPDIIDIKTEDIIVCKIVGEWGMSNKRMLTYT